MVRLTRKRVLAVRSSDKVILAGCFSKNFMVKFRMSLVPEVELSLEQFPSIIFYGRKGNVCMLLNVINVIV